MDSTLEPTPLSPGMVDQQVPLIPARNLGARLEAHPVIFAAMGALVLAIGVALYTRTLPDYYVSEARILSDMGRPGATPMGVWTPGVERESNGNPEKEGPTLAYSDMLRSRWINDRLLSEKFDFHQASWGFGPGPMEHHITTLKDYLGARTTDEAIRRLQGILSVQRDSKSGLLTLSVETRSPELSQLIARRTVSLLEELLVHLSQQAGDQRKGFTERQLKIARQEYNEAKAKMLAFLDRNYNYQTSPDPSIKVQGDRLQMEIDLAKQVVTNLALHHEQAQIDATNDTPP